MRVVLDCDPGQDDAVALAVAAQRCDLVGVVTVAGNVALTHTTTNALALTEMLGLDVPVHAGEAQPLHGVLHDASRVHGASGLAGVTLPPVTREVASHDGVGFLLDAARAHDDLWIIAVGPLTNVATAIQRDPGFAGRLAGITIMGGGLVGNNTPVAEFNIATDPEAAEIVLACGAPMVLCGLDLTRQVPVTPEVIARLAALPNRFGPFSSSFLQAYLDRVRGLTDGVSGPALHDPCAVLALTDPDLFEMTPRHVRVECTGTYTRGMTVVDLRPWITGGNVRLCERIDADRALDIIVGALAAAP